ncbi:MAG: hypothetical protein WD775_14300 [Burkholderiales bacterium]
MTTLEIKLSLPDQLASQAEAAGILTPEGIERLVREALKREAGRRLNAIAEELRGADFPPMSEEELNAEIAAVRAELRLERARSA